VDLELSGEERGTFREALTDAYPVWNDLRIMVSDQLDQSLPLIAAQGNQRHVAFELIEWARAHGKLATLIEGSRRANPENNKLFLFAQKIGLVSTDAKKSTLEKVVSGNVTFLDVAKWRAELTRTEWRVCRVDLDGKGNGTGFLVGPDTVLTNHHVVADAIVGTRSPRTISCRFDYKLAPQGDVISAGSVFPLADDWLIDSLPHSPVDLLPDPKAHDPSDEELDYALLRLRERVGARPAGNAEQAEPRGWVKLDGKQVDFAAQKVVAILQHPKTLPLKLALGMNQAITINAAGNRIRHTVPTEGGSSGSPVFNADWELVALHHSGDPEEIKPEFNEAIPIAKIVARPKVQAWLEQMLDDEE